MSEWVPERDERTGRVMTSDKRLKYVRSVYDEMPLNCTHSEVFDAYFDALPTLISETAWARKSESCLLVAAKFTLNQRQYEKFIEMYKQVMNNPKEDGLYGEKGGLR